MNSKYLTKKKLIAINQKAIKAGANAIEPEFLAGIPDRFKYPVDRAIPFPERHGWVRCFVGIGTTIPPTEKDFRSLLLDMPEKDFKRLPTINIAS